MFSGHTPYYITPGYGSYPENHYMWRVIRIIMSKSKVQELAQELVDNYRYGRSSARIGWVEVYLQDTRSHLVHPPKEGVLIQEKLSLAISWASVGTVPIEVAQEFMESLEIATKAGEEAIRVLTLKNEQ
jgi:hypothetical protein